MSEQRDRILRPESEEEIRMQPDVEEVKRALDIFTDDPTELRWQALQDSLPKRDTSGDDLNAVLAALNIASEGWQRDQALAKLHTAVMKARPLSQAATFRPVNEITDALPLPIVRGQGRADAGYQVSVGG